MKKKVIQELLVGERSLFQAEDLSIFNCTFEDGESPLKKAAILICMKQTLNGSILYGIQIMLL